LSTAAALVILWLVQTPIYNEPWMIDPWLYTALMANFDFVYDHFGTTYYASRLPAILPGYFLNGFLTPEQAYVVLHLVFFLVGGLFLYLLMRMLFGVRVAVLLYPAILTNAIYVDAHTWDYVDGFVITYLAGGLYFLASCIGRRSRVRPALAGFFFAAAVATNLFAVLVVLAGIAAYLYVRGTTDRRAPLERIAAEGSWVLTGAGVLLVACGLFARQHGGQFLFFMPSIDALHVIDATVWKAQDYGWIGHEPRLFVPGFLVAVVALTWRRGHLGQGERLGLSCTVAGAGIVLGLAFWEFLGSGTVLQHVFYFDQLLPLFFVMLTAAVFGLLGWVSSDAVASLGVLAAIGLIVGAAPFVVTFGIGQTEPWGAGAAITVALMALTLLLALVVRLGFRSRLAPAVSFVAAMLAIASVGYASAENLSTQLKMAKQGPQGSAGDVLSIGVQLMDFMERNGLEEDTLPAFWYDQSRDSSLRGLQSLYYYGYTLVSEKMPLPEPELRSRLESMRARHVVLLCSDPTCGGGGEALHHAGYKPMLVAAARLESGSKAVWVEAYRMGM
jgi:hypothetical protein